MKKGFIIFGFLITFILSGLAAFASGNYLHTITLEKSNTGYNVILGSDSMAKVVKKTPSDNELVLELSGITSSDTVKTKIIAGEKADVNFTNDYSNRLIYGTGVVNHFEYDGTGWKWVEVE